MTAPLLLRPGREKVDGAGLVADATLAAWPRLQGRPASEAGAFDGVLAGPPAPRARSGARRWRRRAASTSGSSSTARTSTWCCGIRAAGWDTALVREAVAVHVGGATTGRRSEWQRRQFAFARGYLLRRWGVLRTRAAARTLALETAVAVGDLAASRDLAALRGRVAGWRVARGLPRHELPAAALDPMGWRENVRRRRGDYADAADS